jgi:hypothetical protein
MATKKKPIPATQKQQVSMNKPVENINQPKTQPTPVSYSKNKTSDAGTLDFAFGKLNYILMLGGIVLIALGFILMMGGGSKDPKVFDPAIFNTTRLTVSPILILLGFAVEIVAILKKPRS